RVLFRSRYREVRPLVQRRGLVPGRQEDRAARTPRRLAPSQTKAEAQEEGWLSCTDRVFRVLNRVGLRRQRTGMSKKKATKPRERIGRCFVSGWGVSKDGKVTIVERHEIPMKSSKKRRKAS